ncbi:MAG: GumC family protein [candidate division KSB1 bacterium]|nr:GumC family protein [candidate division KSB1 bacterium]
MDNNFSGISERQQPNSLRPLLTILFKRKAIILSVFFSVVITVTIGSLLMKPVFKANSKILVEKEIDSEKSLLFRMNFNLAFEKHDFIKSEIEILKSTPVALQIIESLNLLQNEFKTMDPGDINLILNAFKSGLNVENEKDSNVLDISYESGDPAIAAAVVNNLVKSYIKYRSELFSESDQYQFFDEQIQLAESKLRDLEERETQFKQAHEMLSPSAQSTILLGKLSDYEKAMTEVRTQRIGKEAMLRVIKEEIINGDRANIPVTETSNALSREKYIAKLRGDMLDLQLRRDQLLQKYTPEYEEVVNLEQAIAATRKRIENEIDEIVSLEETAIRALKAEEEALQNTIDDLDQQIKAFAQKEYDLTQLSRGIEDNREVYSMLLKQREESRISQAKLERGVKIKVISPALVPSQPIKPKKRMNVMLGIILGMVSGLGLAFFIEYFDHSMNSPEDVEERLNLPVWGSIKAVDIRDN